MLKNRIYNMSLVMAEYEFENNSNIFTPLFYLLFDFFQIGPPFITKIQDKDFVDNF